MKLEFSGQIFKNKILRFHDYSSSASRDVACGQTDGHDEANGRFMKFWERA